MGKDLDLWQFIAMRLSRGETVMLLLVAESSGSSPGRAGYKMAVAADGELVGSIGGGVMEVSLVEQAKGNSNNAKGKTEIIQQVHRRDVPGSSGMICSGRQIVLMRPLEPGNRDEVGTLIHGVEGEHSLVLEITRDAFEIHPDHESLSDVSFEQRSETEFVYRERIGTKPQLYIIGGGHCALALSELASKLGFRISIFDDRPGLNTLAKNEFADEITIIESYDRVGEQVANGGDVYVVVMTLGYTSDAVVIRQLIGHDLRYFGVLGSRAKMATLMRELREEGFDADKLQRIRTPIGLAINSRTPEEIAVSIAAEIIAVKNA